MARRKGSVTNSTQPTRAFDDVWRTLDLDEATLAADHGATIVPERTSWEEIAGSVDLPTLGIAGEREGTPELTITGSLGRGGMGVVYLATQTSLGREVAVKSLLPERRDEPSRHKLLQEAWITGLLEHPNIVPIHQLGKNAHGEPVLVMKLVEGRSWADLLDALPGPAPGDGGGEDGGGEDGGGEATDPMDSHLEILIDVCHALEFAHSRGIVHRDIKPDNVMIGSFGEVYLLDWGVAVSTREGGGDGGRLPRAVHADHIAGTPAYMAPEMTDPSLGPVSPRTDVYLLGAVLHQVITGAPPHRGESLYAVLYAAHASEPPRFDDTVPEELADICRRALSREPGRRYADVATFRRALHAYLRHRASYAVGREARRRLRDLERMLDDGGAVDRHRAYELFGQCRSGFQQARQIYDGNADALDGEQAAIARMVDYEIERGAHEAAQLLIEQMPRPALADRERREALERRLAHKRDEIARLRRLEQELDLGVGAHSRIGYVLALGVFWGLLSVSTGILLRLGLMDLTTSDLLIPHTLFGGGLTVAAVVWRRSLMGNTANRRLMLAFLLIFFGSTVQGIAAVLLQQELADVVVGNELLMFVVLAMIAVSIDGRLAAVAAIYLISSLTSAALRPYAFDIAGIADLVGMSLLAILWRPREDAEGGGRQTARRRPPG